MTREDENRRYQRFRSMEEAHAEARREDSERHQHRRSSDAKQSGFGAAVKNTLLNGQSYVSVSLLCLIVGFAYALGKSTSSDKNEYKVEVTALTGEIASLRKENLEQTKALKEQIQNLKESMNERAAHRDKEIDAMNKRLDLHDQEFKEFISASRK